MLLEPISLSAAPPRAAAPRARPWLRLLSALLELGSGKGELVSHAERAWASATFCGSRHRIVLHFRGIEGIEAGELFAECLPEHEFTIPRTIVADAAIIAVNQTALPEPGLTIEAELLLLEDC